MYLLWNVCIDFRLLKVEGLLNSTKKKKKNDNLVGKKINFDYGVKVFTYSNVYAKIIQYQDMYSIYV